MIPQGYAYPNASENFTINDGNAQVARLAKFGLFASLTVLPFGTGPFGPPQVTIKAAIAAGVTPEDPIALAVNIVGVDGPRSCADIGRVLAAGAVPGQSVSALLELFVTLFDTVSAPSRLVTALANNPAAASAVATQLA